MLVSKIIRQSFIDGPGSRMVVFLQGCNLRCIYCHNPETRGLCSACGKCLTSCPAGALGRQELSIVWRAEMCRGCECCLGVCPESADPRAQWLPAGEIYRRFAADAAFLDGITLSGGEASRQSREWLPLAGWLHNDGKTLFVDSNGMMTAASRQEVLTAADGVLLDFKALDRRVHRALTGVDNLPVLEFMAAAAAADKLYELRTVIVPGYTDAPDSIAAMARHIACLPGRPFWRLIAFRRHGVRGDGTGLPEPGGERMEELAAVAAAVLGRGRIIVR
ncbi:MAG: YjjW family glycine radical enzyme activase [Negativicutes bacterium]|nr:YjjW family glycine radical enzyme activase [Negativicutes bacterium]